MKKYDEKININTIMGTPLIVLVAFEKNSNKKEKNIYNNRKLDKK